MYAGCCINSSGTRPTADAELVELARDEIMSLTKQLEALEEQLKVLLLPRDPLDDKNIMLEVQQHVSLLLLSYRCTYRFARVPVARRPRCGQPTL